MILDTIVAQCTPSGSGAIALIRISGPQAFSLVSECARLSSKQELVSVATHTIHHGWVVARDGTHLDEVMFLAMHAPRTFTGEEVIEITCHNNPFIIESIIERLIVCGARPAQNGEFSRQAVENGKLDLLKAEAINELIHANSQQALKLSLSQLEGSFSKWVHQLERELIKIAALCDASFEFIEEDIDFSDQMREMLAAVLAKVRHIKQTFDQQQQLRQGVRIALIGSVNAGKSSLFNTLVGKNRAIVTEIAGTTRDVIEAGLYKNGTYWTLSDTAGLRQTNNVVEKQGIERSYQEAQTADIVLLICDGSRHNTPEETAVYSGLLKNYSQKIILLRNKADKLTVANPLFENALSVSSMTGIGIKELEALLEEKIQNLFAKDSCPFLLNKRHFILLVSLEQKLEIVEEMLAISPEYELVAYHLKDALEGLTELTGKSITEDVMNAIFREFCIGK